MEREEDCTGLLSVLLGREGVFLWGGKGYTVYWRGVPTDGEEGDLY